MSYAFTPEKSLYINGKWQSGDSTVSNINPSDISDTVGDFAQASVGQLHQAIQSARAVQHTWEAVPMEQKQSILHKIGDELIARCDDLGSLLSREEGKPFAEGRGEVYRSGQFFHYYAAEVLRQMGDLADSVRPNVRIEVTREAVGVVGIISPWNFPMATAVWKIAPALAYGNTVVWKPANLTPASAVALAEIFHRHGVPAGVFNVVLGTGGTIGDALIHSDKIDALSFTGSVQTGRLVAAATAANFVKCQLEMGSKNALYVAGDADIETAVNCAVAGAYSGTGQKCTASSRLIVDAAVHDVFVEALTARLATLKVGHALDDGVFMGPVVDNTQLQSNLHWVANAKQQGAECVFGGNRLHLDTDGYYMQPTLFINTDNTWDINRQEVFAPMACVIKVWDFDEALYTVNDTKYGLTAGIITQSLRLSTQFKRTAQTGCVMVNLPTAGTDYHVPFGGRKHSSFGAREQGTYAKEFYTVVKTTYQTA